MRPIFSFLGRVVLFGVPILIAWWLIMPVYASILANAVVTPLHALGATPTEAVSIQKKGVLYSGSLIELQGDGRGGTLEFGGVALGVAFFVTLMLASKSLSQRRRFIRIGLGIGLLAVAHALYLASAITFKALIRDDPEMPTALVELVGGMPFLLWLIFAFWDSRRPFEGDIVRRDR